MQEAKFALPVFFFENLFSKDRIYLKILDFFSYTYMQQLFKEYKIIFYTSKFKNIRKAFTKEKRVNDF